MALNKSTLITVDAGVMGGVPCVRRLRIPVATVVRLVAGGCSETEIVTEYPDLRLAYVWACLEYADRLPPEAGDEAF